MAAGHKRLAQLTQRLGYSFVDDSLLRRALTHRSFSAEHNERLEFLGDSVLNLVVSSELYGRFPDLAEGELTRLRAMLVREATLADIARSIELGDFLCLGGGELKSGGFDRDSILADSLEAVFGAIFAEGGLAPTTTAIHRLYDERLATLDPGEIPKDPKTALQELLQREGRPLPAYDLREIRGEAHNQQFFVDCVVEGMLPVRGEGGSRRAAEQDAAAKALAILHERSSR